MSRPNTGVWRLLASRDMSVPRSHRVSLVVVKDRHIEGPLCWTCGEWRDINRRNRVRRSTGWRYLTRQRSKGRTEWNGDQITRLRLRYLHEITSMANTTSEAIGVGVQLRRANDQLRLRLDLTDRMVTPGEVLAWMDEADTWALAAMDQTDAETHTEAAAELIGRTCWRSTPRSASASKGCRCDHYRHRDTSTRK